MQFITKWKRRVERVAEAHEEIVTISLLGVAVVLILIAMFGEAHHKAMAMVYIVL